MTEKKIQCDLCGQLKSKNEVKRRNFYPYGFLWVCEECGEVKE